MNNTLFDIAIADEMKLRAMERLNLSSYTKEEQPKLILLGGQPASGKSSVIDEIVKDYKGNIVVLNSDDYKEYYPRYSIIMKDNPERTTEVQPYSNYVLGEILKDVAPKGVNVLLEGTMRNADYPLEVINGFKACGYHAEAKFIATNYHSSSIGIVERFETELADKGYGRAVPQEHHDLAYKGIPLTIETLANSGKLSDISIITREGDILAQASRGDDVVKVYNSYRENLTPEIAADIYNRIKDVTQMLENRGAYHAEFENLKNIITSIDKAFEPVFLQIRDAAQKLENIPTIDREVKDVKEIANTILSFGSNTTISEVLSSFEKHAPHLVEEIRNSNTIKYFDTELSLNHLDAKTVAEHLSNKTNGKIGVEFEQQEKSKGFER